LKRNLENALKEGIPRSELDNLFLIYDSSVSCFKRRGVVLGVQPLSQISPILWPKLNDNAAKKDKFEKGLFSHLKPALCLSAAGIYASSATGDFLG
jgi:hypothetical protein